MSDHSHIYLVQAGLPFDSSSQYCLELISLLLVVFKPSLLLVVFKPSESK